MGFSRLTAFVFCLASLCSLCLASNLIDTSRNNAVLVFAQLPSGPKSVTEAGSGFFLDQTHVATCFHVVYTIVPSKTPGASDIKPAVDLKVVLTDGETIAAEPVLLPLGDDSTPFYRDFAVLRLKTEPKMTVKACPLASDIRKQQIGSVITFSGYPLVDSSPSFTAADATSGFLHTFVGNISGYSKDYQLIGLQAPVNHGSSGSAVLNAKGEVIGIVSNEHSKFDAMVQQALTVNVGADKWSPEEAKGFILLFRLIRQLGQTDSNGIGYARAIDGLRDYLKKYPAVLKN
jgi:S1-C subfamily serine protease